MIFNADHIETSQMIFNADQLTSFFMRGRLVLNVNKVVLVYMVRGNSVRS